MGLTVAQAKVILALIKKRQAEIAQQFEQVEMLGERLTTMLPDVSISPALKVLEKTLKTNNARTRAAIDRLEKVLKEDEKQNAWKGEDREL